MPKEKVSTSHKVFTVIGVILCVILIPVLIINITLIIKSNTNKDKVPSIGGWFPMIVLTDSMYPDIKSGDLIICRTIDADKVKKDDVISFFDPAGNGSSVVTHSVVEVVNKDGKLFFRTKGINNNTEDKEPVPAENLVGIYKTRIAGAGKIAMFMQTTAGLIVCVILPILLLIGYDIIRRGVYEKKNQADTEALLAELEALKAEKAKKAAGAEKTEKTVETVEAVKSEETEKANEKEVAETAGQLDVRSDEETAGRSDNQSDGQSDNKPADK